MSLARRSRTAVLAASFASLLACSSATSPPSGAAPDGPDAQVGAPDAQDAADSVVTDSASDARDDAPLPARIVFERETVRRIEPAGAGAVLFLEPIGGHLIDERVQRSLAWTDARGAIVANVKAAEDEELVDAVGHPSGASSVFLRKGDHCLLRRYDAKGAVLAETTLGDFDRETDPTEPDPDPDGPPWNVGRCQPNLIHETGRLAADGEALYLVNRGGSHGMVLFRLRFDAGAYQVEFRTPIAPRHRAYQPTGIGASHRLLRMRNWSWVPRVAVDDDHRARVLLVFGGGLPSETYDATAAFPAGPESMGVVLTVSTSGVVSSSRALPRELAGAGLITELETLRWARGSVVLAGRTTLRPPPADGFGWDALVVRFVDGESAPRMRARFDVGRGEVVSDLLALDDGAWLAAGRSGYWQNPTGASVSEEAQSAAWVLGEDGRVLRTLELAQGLRHNAALTVARLASGAILLGGLENGPGAHSADADPTLRRSDGWLVSLAGVP